MRTLYTLALAGLLAGCGVVVKGGPLSNRPDTEKKGVYLTTGGSPRPFRTLGFAQVRGYGVNVAGIADLGDAALDGTIRGTLAAEAAKMGGDAVINIEFLDENPQTPAERAAAAANTVNSSMQGKPQVETKDRWVTVTGEIIQFVGP